MVKGAASTVVDSHDSDRVFPIIGFTAVANSVGLNIRNCNGVVISGVLAGASDLAGR